MGRETETDGPEGVVVATEYTAMPEGERLEREAQDEVARVEAEVKAMEIALRREAGEEESEITRVVVVKKPVKKYSKWRSLLVAGDLRMTEGLGTKVGKKVSGFFHKMEKWGQDMVKKNSAILKKIPILGSLLISALTSEPVKSWEDRDKEEEKKAKKEKKKTVNKKKRIDDLVSAGGFSKEQATAIIEGREESGEDDEKDEKKSKSQAKDSAA